MRKGVEVGEMRTFAIGALMDLGKIDDSMKFAYDEQEMVAKFEYHGIHLTAKWFDNSVDLGILSTTNDLNIKNAFSFAEKAFAYRCIDHVCHTCPGVRAIFDPESGNLVIGVKSAGFGEQFRADTMIDIALFMIEEAVMEARKYLGLPFTPVEPVRVDQWDGGYHFGEGIKTYSSARDAFAAYMVKHEGCQEVQRDQASILLESGPVQYEIRGFGWPNGYMAATATRGFKHAYADDERYVRIQERLVQPILDPKRPEAPGRNLRDPARSSIAYFQPDGTFVVAEYGFGNIRTDENGKAFANVATQQMLNVFYMTYLAEELPDDLYSDELNRVN